MSDEYPYRITGKQATALWKLLRDELNKDHHAFCRWWLKPIIREAGIKPRENKDDTS